MRVWAKVVRRRERRLERTLMSRPRCATSVATRMGVSPFLNCSSTYSRGFRWFVLQVARVSSSVGGWVCVSVWFRQLGSVQFGSVRLDFFFPLSAAEPIFTHPVALALRPIARNRDRRPVWFCVRSLSFIWLLLNCASTQSRSSCGLSPWMASAGHPSIRNSRVSSSHLLIERKSSRSWAVLKELLTAAPPGASELLPRVRVGV